MESSVGGGVRSRGGWSPQQRWRAHQTAERRPLHLATICLQRFYRSAASSPLIGRQLGSYWPPATAPSRVPATQSDSRRRQAAPDDLGPLESLAGERGAVYLPQPISSQPVELPDHSQSWVTGRSELGATGSGFIFLSRTRERDREKQLRSKYNETGNSGTVRQGTKRQEAER